MSTVMCPRCREQRPGHWFPKPVSICIVCYSLCPGNEGLDVASLFHKAQKSICAKRTIKKNTGVNIMYAKQIEREMSNLSNIDTLDDEVDDKGQQVQQVAALHKRGLDILAKLGVNIDKPRVSAQDILHPPKKHKFNHWDPPLDIEVEYPCMICDRVRCPKPFKHGMHPDTQDPVPACDACIALYPSEEKI